MAIYDLDNDGIKEIIVNTGTGEAWAMNTNGHKLWQTRLYFKEGGGGYYREPIFIAKVDNEPQQNKVIVSAFVDNGTVFILDGITGEIEKITPKIPEDIRPFIVYGELDKKAIDIDINNFFGIPKFFSEKLLHSGRDTDLPLA
ncbi:MAG: hypothetical protein KJ893_06555 [Candidatus Omnitrophica bacterium]|nr:hypothetical protein [Candidatus Omnitrophota bacterium]MBU4477851.1 hypothetical protein [Candidatus Omnitrophota bacterium]MCG2703475.1 hypothetical protein [Candidatus Omnitrophota bacterium]